MEKMASLDSLYIYEFRQCHRYIFLISLALVFVLNQVIQQVQTVVIFFPGDTKSLAISFNVSESAIITNSTSPPNANKTEIPHEVVTEPRLPRLRFMPMPA